MAKKELKNQEVETSSKEEVIEEVKQEIAEENEPITYSSSYLETIETERARFLSTYRSQNILRWVLSFVSIGLVIFAFIVIPNIMPDNSLVVSIAILVAALALTIAFSILSKRFLNKKMHEYFALYYQNVNEHVFKDIVKDMQQQFPGRIEPQAFTDNGLYKEVADVGSRGLLEFEYEGIPVAVVDAAAQARNEKRLVPIFVGKYIYAASSYSYDEPLYIYFKGDKRALPPNNLDNVKVVQDDKKMVVYSNSADWKKVLTKEVKSILQSIEMNKELVDLSIALQKGRIFVCMGYDDPLMVLPLQKPFNPKPTEIFKKDVRPVLKLIKELNK